MSDDGTHLPDDDSIDIELRTVDDVYRRAVALLCLVRRQLIEEITPADHYGIEYYTAETDRYDLLVWARQELREALSVDELAILSSPVGSLTEDDLAACEDAANAAEALSWALGVVDRLDPLAPADAAVIERLLDWSPAPWVPAGRAAQGASLRPLEDVAEMRERTELWYWRATVVQTDDDPDLLATIVADTAREAASAGLVNEIDDDFAVDNLPFRNVSPDRKASIEAWCASRLLALNWTAGFGDGWATTPLFPE